MWQLARIEYWGQSAAWGYRAGALLGGGVVMADTGWGVTLDKLTGTSGFWGEIWSVRPHLAWPQCSRGAGNHIPADRGPVELRRDWVSPGGPPGNPQLL